MQQKSTWRVLIFCCLGLLIGCSRKTLSLIFDGVPPPEKPVPVAAPQDTVTTTANSRASHTQHGPFAAKECGACHNPNASNNLVLPEDQLCSVCHEFPMEKKYIHGPVVGGGCLVCHDPHQSPYRALLKSESDNFCFDCHDQNSILQSAAHKDATLQCTTCHDAHMSDRKYLLK